MAKMYIWSRQSKSTTKSLIPSGRLNPPSQTTTSFVHPAVANQTQKAGLQGLAFTFYLELTI
jgi:hypothetical protein